ncbi:MAG: hypothetical protein ACLSVD_04175 [Eggerthellaceae bacterium]
MRHRPLPVPLERGHRQFLQHQWPAIFGHEFSGVIAEVGKNAPENLRWACA